MYLFASWMYLILILPNSYLTIISTHSNILAIYELTTYIPTKMSTIATKNTTKTTKVAKPTTNTDEVKTTQVKTEVKVKPLNLQKVDEVPAEPATPRMDEVKTAEPAKKKRKVEKTIGGLNFEQYMRALLARDQNIHLSAAITFWEMTSQQIESGELKNTSRSNKNKKSSSPDEPKVKSPYQLFGKWLKEKFPEYKGQPVSEFSQLQSSMWKNSPEADEWKEANNYVEPASASKKSKKSTTEEPKSDKPKAKAVAAKPAKKAEPVKKAAPVEDDSDVDADDDFEEAQEVDDELDE